MNAAPRIKMLNYMLEHEAVVTAALRNRQSTEGQLRQLMLEHDLKLAWFQHERLVHLLVMILIILLFMIAFCLLLFLDMLLLLILVLMLGVLSAAYIFYYFQMENTVQRAYPLRDMIKQRIQEQRQMQVIKKNQQPTAVQMTQENRPPVS